MRYKTTSPDAVAEARKVLDAGGIVAFPTETVYGLAVRADLPDALGRLRDLKDRPQRPFTVHIGRREQVRAYIDPVPAPARQLMRRAWPGPLTLVLPVSPSGLTTEAWRGDIQRQLCYEGTIGFRCPDHPAATELLVDQPGPVVAPSANPAGKPPATSAEMVLDWLDGRIDCVLDGGPSRLAKASTIAAVGADGTVRLLREGAYDQRMLEDMMRRRILFVCTGNTCRSPMAEVLARLELAEQLGCEPDALADRGWDIQSAGVAAVSGAPAAPESQQAVAELGGDLSAHRSQPAGSELINSSDLIFCMTDQHRTAVLDVAPTASQRVLLLDETGPIGDPIGAGIDTYRQVAEHIQQAIRTRMSEILP